MSTSLFPLQQSNGTSHKRLQWTHVLGNAVVKGTFGKHSYDLQVHTLQAIALMEFNATKGEVSTSTAEVADRRWMHFVSVFLGPHHITHGDSLKSSYHVINWLPARI
jgi:fructosamine-3-kinase